MTTKVFIDGKAGTTGLRIYERLQLRNDIQLMTLSEEDRKKPECRKEMLNTCDIAFLCLPDDASREAVAMIENPEVVVLDTSTAHRTCDDWAYGFPELSPAFFQKITTSKRIAVPGCHASGFIALVRPLIDAGILSADALLTCHSLTGYSGGGKKMIAEYADANRPQLFDAPRQYGLTQQHKHLKEMVKITGSTTAPIFCPIVADYYSGMLVTVPVFKSQLNNGATVENIREVYRNLYNGNMVFYAENASEGGLLSGNAMSGKDSMQIMVEGNEDRILLIARYDNLGKGASGAAVECMNIVMKQAPETGLDL
ncbi:MAG: N-acetyl-gamma-glutamyl-phosphate reductase [Lentisphaeria bacterium]|nr:N-acetyl-gamma-glutamyl-phosphate reductase [Lentisphaeria bacterium]